MRARLAWRSIWRHRRRTVITVVSIAFGLACVIFFISLNEGVYAQLVDDAVRMQAGHVTIEHAEYREAPAIDLTVRGATASRSSASSSTLSSASISSSLGRPLFAPITAPLNVPNPTSGTRFMPKGN